MEMSRLTRNGTAETVSRDQILRHERGQGKIHFSCSADHVQDRQPYPVDPYSCYMCDHTYIGHTESEDNHNLRFSMGFVTPLYTSIESYYGSALL